MSEQELLNIMINGDTLNIRVQAMSELTIRCRNDQCCRSVKLIKGSLQRIDFRSSTLDYRIATARQAVSKFSLDLSELVGVRI